MMQTGESKRPGFFAQVGILPFMVVGVGLLLRFGFGFISDAPAVPVAGTVLVVVGGVWGIIRWARAA